MYKKLFSETLIYGIGAILPRLINFVLTRLYTAEIDPEGFSKFAQLYALVAFVNVFLTFGFETAYFRFSANKSIAAKVFHTAFWFVLVNAFSFLMAMYVFKVPLAHVLDYENHSEYLIWFAWIAFFDALCMVPFAVLRFTNRPIKYSAIKVFQGVFQTILIILFFYAVPFDFFEKMGVKEKVAFPFIANVIASASGVLLLLPILFKVRLIFDWQLFKKMFHYAYPLMLAGLAFVVNENLDKLVLRGMISKADAGSYAGCYKLAVLMTLFVTAYRMGVEPYFFKKANDKDAKKTYANILQYFTIFSGAAVIALLANISWLKNLLIEQESYLVALDIVPIIIIANLFFGIYYNLSTWYKVTDKTYVGTIISWIGAGLTIGFNLIFIPLIGFIASAWATLIAYGSMMVVSYFWGQKYYRIPYKVRKILIYLTLSITFGLTAYFGFYSNIFIGNLLLLIYIAFAFFIEKASLQLEQQNHESKNN